MVQKANAFDVGTRYDGDFEKNVKKENVEAIGLSPRGIQLNHAIGARVEAKFRGKSKWYKGKITKHNPDGTYNIEYDDGDTELRVKSDHVRAIRNSRHRATSFDRGIRSPSSPTPKGTPKRRDSF